jgi:hypothetical protein
MQVEIVFDRTPDTVEWRECWGAQSIGASSCRVRAVYRFQTAVDARVIFCELSLLVQVMCVLCRLVAAVQSNAVCYCSVMLLADPLACC